MTASFKKLFKKLRKARRALRQWQYDRRLNAFTPRPAPTVYYDASFEQSIGNETQGLFLDFTSNPYETTKGLHGNSIVRDRSTLTNNFGGAPYELLTYSSPSVKLCRGPDGLLRYGAHNLCVKSEAIDQWNYAHGSTITSSDITPPPGYGSAFKLVGTEGNVSRKSAESPYIGQIGLIYTVSAVLKAGGIRYGGVGISNRSAFWTSALFDLEEGILETTVTLSASGAVLSADIESLGDGWFLCTATIQTLRNARPIIMMSLNGDGAEWEGDGSSGIYMTGFHVRHAPSPSLYFKTEDNPVYELPYEWDENGDLLGIRVEEQRTNLCLYSSDLTQSAWTKSNITAAKTATGPDGVANSASTLTATAANGYVQQDITSASAVRITSVYVKRRTGTGAVYLSQGEPTGSGLVPNGGFDADTDWTKGLGWSIGSGVAVHDGGVGAGAINQSISVTGGKFYRVTATLSGLSGGPVYWRLGTSAVNIGPMTTEGTITQVLQAPETGNYIGIFCPPSTSVTIDDVSVFEVDETELDVTNDWTRVNTDSATLANPTVLLRIETSGDEIDVALFQHEVGSFVTSPIETAGSTVTRAADNISLATSKFPYNAAEGTLYVSAGAPVTSGVPTLAELGTGTAVERLLVLYRRTGTVLTMHAADGGATQVNTDIGSYGAATEFKIAAAYRLNDYAGSLNGGAVATDNLATLGDANVLRIGAGAFSGSGPWNGHLKSIAYLPRRMSNTELQTLTRA